MLRVAMASPMQETATFSPISTIVDLIETRYVHGCEGMPTSYGAAGAGKGRDPDRGAVNLTDQPLVKELLIAMEPTTIML